jgi:DUF1365 family protein
MGALGIRVQGITLWARRVPVVPRVKTVERETEPEGRRHQERAEQL